MLMDYNSFYLVGIKGVAMTALAQCLLDAGKQVTGWDVPEQFVTHELLTQRQIQIDSSPSPQIAPGTECVIFTAAHLGPANPLVIKAQADGLPCLSHAEALAELFNQQQGLAVCGVGGKSTTSAMLAWIMDQAKARVSFAIGVGNIPGLDKTGQWAPDNTFFVAEADEYVVDPAAVKAGQPIVPRFSFMKPWVTICTNLKFDHPDVYQDFDQTLAVYSHFFNQIKPDGCLILNQQDRHLLPKLSLRPDLRVLWYGESEADCYITDSHSTQGTTKATLHFQDKAYDLELLLPGTYNLLNAAAATLAAYQAGIQVEVSLQALKSFHSTKRRAEYIGEKHGIRFYDDYAHHPSEVAQVIEAFKAWFPDSKLVVAFQSHTYSRTKALFEDFIPAFDQADEVAMIDIFASAREAFDDSISSDMLCQAINQRAGVVKATNYHDLHSLATHLNSNLRSGNVCLTIGAGDIYQLHDMVEE